MKKEDYFTLESIGKKARSMLSDIKELRKQHSLKLCPRRAGLLVIDMQRYFLEKDSHAFIPSGQAIVTNISQLINSCYQKKIPLIFTQHLNTEDDAGMMSTWWRDLIRPGSHSSEIIPAFDTSKGTIIRKSQYDAFYGTKLERILRDKGISQVIICGVITHLCCEATARSAFVRGFKVSLTIDGTATYNEQFHRATLWSAAHGFAVPMLTNEIISQLT